MKRSIGLVLTLALTSAWTAHSQADRSVWDGVYTDEQATRGQNVFTGICAECHATEDFTGSTFLLGWEASTALDLVKLVQGTMPMDAPGSLRPEEYTDVVAYFFRLNGFPAGKVEMDNDAERLKTIRIESKK